MQPGRDDRPAFEQPACLHGNMDLYKHAFRLSPMIASDLVADCFELAWDIRVMDMRAEPLLHELIGWCHELIGWCHELTGCATCSGREVGTGRLRGHCRDTSLP